MTLRPYVPDLGPAAKGTVFVIGDSIAYGTLSGGIPNDGPGWPTILGYTNLAVPGAVMARTNTAPEILEQLNSVPGSAGTLIISGATNNFGLFRTSFSVARQFTFIERMAYRKGVDNTLVCTVPPWGPNVLFTSAEDLAAHNVQRADFNTWLREIYGPRGQLVDLASVLGGDLLDPSFDAGDGVHLTAAGQNAAANYVGPRVTALTL